MALYSQFVDLISPDLRRPFNTLTQEVQQLQTKDDAVTLRLASQMDQHISEIKLPIEKLINISGRIQMRNAFKFQIVRFDEIAQQAIRNLRTMADARRVAVEFNASTPHTTVLGDEEQLLEAAHHLLHNAIKFNKIGGVVQVECGLAGSELFLRVVDTGVGIPPERLEDIWLGLAKLKAMIESVAVPPKLRKATKPTRAEKARRIEAKKQLSGKKQNRRPPTLD